MAGEPPRPRPTWRPPTGDDPASAPKFARPATQILRVSDLRAADEPPPPREAEPPPPPDAPVDLRGASTGRRLSDAPAPAPAPPPADPPPRAGSPFQPFAAHGARLARAPRSDNLPVLALVGGLLFVVVAAVVLVAVALVLGAKVVDDVADALPGLNADEPERFVDTDVGEVAEPVAPVRRPGGASTAVVAPQRLDGTIVLGESRPFNSIEVNCPKSGVRARATFRGGQATVRDLPVDEDCVVTFQGAEPARTTLRGGQTRTCVFGPTRCETR